MKDALGTCGGASRIVRASEIPRGDIQKLAHDPGPDAAEALVKAAGDKNLTVRAAALEAIAFREDRSLIPKISAALDDGKDVVRFTAAACVAHLSGLPDKANSSNASKP